jgi:hypothetical protein
MGGSPLLVVVCVYGLTTFTCAAGSPAGPLEAPDVCAGWFAESKRLTGEIERLLVRVDLLEAELAEERAKGRGAFASHLS